MSQKNMPSSQTLSWSQILEAVQAKTMDDVQHKVIPAVNTGRTIVSCLLVALAQKVQPKH